MVRMCEPKCLQPLSTADSAVPATVPTAIPSFSIYGSAWSDPAKPKYWSATRGRIVAAGIWPSTRLHPGPTTGVSRIARSTESLLRPTNRASKPSVFWTLVRIIHNPLRKRGTSNKIPRLRSGLGASEPEALADFMQRLRGPPATTGVKHNT